MARPRDAVTGKIRRSSECPFLLMARIVPGLGSSPTVQKDFFDRIDPYRKLASAIR
jgi:hypothetical protein